VSGSEDAEKRFSQRLSESSARLVSVSPQMELLSNNPAISVGSIPELSSGAHLSADFTPHPHWRVICPHKRRFLQNELWVVAKSPVNSPTTTCHRGMLPESTGLFSPIAIWPRTVIHSRWIPSAYSVRISYYRWRNCSKMRVMTDPSRGIG
jgi:hypothetical protein